MKCKIHYHMEKSIAVATSMKTTPCTYSVDSMHDCHWLLVLHCC